MNELIDKYLADCRRIHFVGIGGSGIAPLAEILHSEGYEITGSDINEGETLDRIKELGIKVFMGHSPSNIDGCEIVVHTAAVNRDNPELRAALEKGIPVFERSRLLGHISRRYSQTICIGGTHGKTTVTSMVTQVFMGAGLDPTVVIGGRLGLIGGNGRSGNSDYFICEACEFADTFLQLSPALSVILNIDADHLEYFGSLENLKKSFTAFADNASEFVIYNSDDKNSVRALRNIDKRKLSFGISSDPDYTATDITEEKRACYSFCVDHKDHPKFTVNLSVPGYHNIYNGLAAAAICLEYGIKPEIIARELNEFKGAGRRFEFLGQYNHADIYDDYAHHPAELEATLTAAKKMGYNRIWAVFQPFTFSRTAMHLDEFARVLSVADKVVLADIMGAREVNTYNISTEDLAKRIKGSVWLDSFDKLAEHIRTNVLPGDMVITLGCGDIYKVAHKILK